MRYNIKFLQVAALLAASSIAVSAEETMVYDLRVQANFDINRQFSVDKDEEPWMWARYTVGSDDVSGPEQYNSSYTDGYYSSAFYTPDLTLEAGTYKVYTKPRKKNSDIATKQAANLRILISQDAMTESSYNQGRMTEIGNITPIAYASTYSADAFAALPVYEKEFTITTPGKYKIAFFNKGASITLHGTYIVKVEAGGTTDPDPGPGTDPGQPDPVIPGLVTGLDASVTGDREVTLSFSLPYEGTKGEGLAGTDLTYTVYRDGDRLTSKGRQTAGAGVRYVDTEVAYGSHTYAVDVTAGDQTGARESVTVDVERPKTPMTTVTLPFADSFAGAYLDESKWEVEDSGGKGTWAAADVLLKGQFLGNWEAVDNDGGLAAYDGWNGADGDWARLITAPITKASSTAPVVDFWFRHSHSRGCKNYLKVQVSADGGDWQDVADAKIQTYIETLDDGGWEYYKFALDPYIKGCETYRVAFTGYNDGISTYLPIDNVQIYNMAEKDIRVLSIEVPETATAGKDLEIKVTLENMGGATVNADAYTFSVDTDFPGEVEFSPVSIPSLESAVVVGKVNVTAEEVLNGPSYSFKVAVNLPGNASGDKVESRQADVTAVFVDYKVPEGVSAVYDNSGKLNVSWESVKDLSHKPININENFNDLPAREQIEVDGEKMWREGAKGDFNGFISVDLDHQDGGSYYSTSGSEFQVFKDFMTGSMPQGHTGQYIGLTLPANTQQDDWLITPVLDAAETSLISLQARIAYIYREGDAYNNTLEVLYSTEDYNQRNPAPSFTKSIMKTTSKATSSDIPHDGLYHWLRINDIPSEAKYVALHFITKSGMQTGVWVDRVWVTENDQQPLEGYYVYQRGVGRLNASPLAIDQLRYVTDGANKDASNTYYVTALYSDGESEPSDIVGVGTDGVSTVASHDAAISVIPGGVMISGAYDTLASVYSLDGKKVAQATCAGVTFIPLQPGLYIVKAGAATVKALVK